MNIKSTFFSFIFILVTTSLLSGCGFHLRGSTPIPPEFKTLYFKSKRPYNELGKNLTELLRTAGVNLTTTQLAAPVTLDILGEQKSQAFSGVGTNATTLEYTLMYKVSYGFSDRYGRPIAGPYTATELRNFATSSDNMLSGSDTQTNLYNGMIKDASYQIINVMLATDTLNKIRAKEAEYKKLGPPKTYSQ